LNPFFASIAILFGLFAAPLANDVQGRDAEAQAAVLREADGVRRFSRYQTRLTKLPNLSRQRLSSYAQSV
jgi:hypothetical protein